MLGKRSPLTLNILYGKAMTEKLPVRGFKWVNDISEIDEDFVKYYNKMIIKAIYLMWI